VGKTASELRMSEVDIVLCPMTGVVHTKSQMSQNVKADQRATHVLLRLRKTKIMMT